MESPSVCVGRPWPHCVCLLRDGFIRRRRRGLRLIPLTCFVSFFAHETWFTGDGPPLTTCGGTCLKSVPFHWLDLVTIQVKLSISFLRSRYRDQSSHWMPGQARHDGEGEGGITLPSSFRRKPESSKNNTSPFRRPVINRIPGQPPHDGEVQQRLIIPSFQ